MRRAVSLAVLLGAGVALAQPKDTPDASEFPDASIAEGGADRVSQESQDSTNVTTCTYDKDCDRGTVCQAHKCVFRPFINATYEGCSVVDGAGVVVAAWALGAVLLRRRRGASPRA